MPDETSRRYLFVAIDRASRWVFLYIYDDQSEESSLDFLKRLQAACPIHIRTILTDNGTQFTDRFTSQQKQPSGNPWYAQHPELFIAPVNIQDHNQAERDRAAGLGARCPCCRLGKFVDFLERLRRA